MSFINNHDHPWLQKTLHDASLFFMGDEDVALKVLSSTRTGTLDGESLSTILKTNNRFSSGVVETPNYIIAWVDHVRSWPIFYTTIESGFYLSNHAQSIQKHCNLDQLCENNCLEFMMSGYVTGKETLYHNLFSLEPGTFLIWNKRKKVLNMKRYHMYQPSYLKTETEQSISKIDSILDELTLRIIKNAMGTKIWIPLSAGLDSRIILCKLHQHGYTNIETFTYGPKHNFEAIHAKRIASKLNVPWRMISLSRKEQKKLFDSPQRRKFWKFADGLKAIPCMREYSAIAYLHNNSIAKSGEIFINGQSGDYITGGHIPETLLNEPQLSSEALYNELINKHYDLWFPLKTLRNLEIIKDKISKSLPQHWTTKQEKQDRAKQIETWEYGGRQVCYVINGQRTYEFFGYKWEMPLWDKILVDFCETLSIDHKKNQKLYKDYLKEYNYMGLFPDKEPYIWRWPMTMIWVIPMAQIVSIIAGAKKKALFYSRMRCHGHYSNQFSFFSRNEHLKTYKNARSIISLYVPAWLKENQLEDKIDQLN